MFSQRRHEIFVTVATVDDGYFDYPFGKSDASSRPFLRLRVFGPFDIFNAQHVAAVGQCVLALMIQLDCSNN